jgi:putative membrane protein
MSNPSETHDPVPPATAAGLARAAVGGVLMGLANLVPGISGGTMLLAAGVYEAFINAIAELTTFRFRLRSILLLGAVGGTAVLAIGALAGPTKTLVVEQRWSMYSLFIGLTLGGVPLVWKLARPATKTTWVGAACAFVVMLLMAFAQPGGGGGDRNALLLLLSGVAGASAMILPGVSGGYLLLLLGQYVTILGAVDSLKTGIVDSLDALRTGGLAVGELLGSSQFAPALDALGVVIPVGIGVVVGVVGVSNAVRWLLEHHPHPTLGALLGLLLGAVVGLWPFQQGVPPQPGDMLKGEVLTAEGAAQIDAEDWPLKIFSPSTGQMGAAAGLILVGFGVTLLVARIGGDSDESNA